MSKLTARGEYQDARLVVYAFSEDPTANSNDFPFPKQREFCSEPWNQFPPSSTGWNGAELTMTKIVLQRVHGCSFHILLMLHSFLSKAWGNKFSFELLLDYGTRCQEIPRSCSNPPVKNIGTKLSIVPSSTLKHLVLVIVITNLFTGHLLSKSQHLNILKHQI